MLPSTPQLLLSPRNSPAAVISGYTGPGDIATFTGWWGLRGYSGAYSTGSNPAADLVDQAGANPITINILSTGALDVASIAAWVTAHSVTTILVTKLYDQVGTRHLTDGGTANRRPTLALAGLGSLPILSFNGTTNMLNNASSYAQVQPYSLSTVARRNAAVLLHQIVGDGAATALFFGTSSGNLAAFAQTTVINFGSGSTEGNFHAIQGMFSAAASIGAVDGTITNPLSATPGSANFAAPTMQNTAWGGNMTIQEMGFAASNISSSFAALNTNQHTYWGF